MRRPHASHCIDGRRRRLLPVAGQQLSLIHIFTDEDRELIRATIAAQSARHVLVTHGTDSMVQTLSLIHI